MRNYAELVKDLRYCADLDKECFECKTFEQDDCFNKLGADAADAIEELLASDVVPTDFHERCLQLEIRKRFELEKQLPHWISVEDELPDVASEVLCYCPFYDCSYTAAFDGERWWHFGGLGTDPIRFKVTHWMPLPEAPKEDAE